jgi:hypothetical protein
MLELDLLGLDPPLVPADKEPLQLAAGTQFDDVADIYIAQEELFTVHQLSQVIVLLEDGSQELVFVRFHSGLLLEKAHHGGIENSEKRGGTGAPCASVVVRRLPG